MDLPFVNCYGADAPANVPVLMLTCLGRTMARINGITSGADDYLMKPIKAGELAGRIWAAISQRAAVASALAR